MYTTCEDLRIHEALRNLAQDETAKLAGVSDGSVRDNKDQGIWAWALLEPGEQPIRCAIEARGRKYVKGLDTQESHSTEWRQWDYYLPWIFETETAVARQDTVAYGLTIGY